MSQFNNFSMKSLRRLVVILCVSGIVAGVLIRPAVANADPLVSQATQFGYQVSSNLDSTCVLASNGTIRCWGLNDIGQLGDGTITNRATPVSVLGVSTAVSVSVGVNSSCALLSDGTIKCWGGNEVGEIGDGTTTNRSTPVSVLGVSNAVAVSVGESQACALLSDETIKCWGANNVLELGDGTTTNRSTPVRVLGVSNAVAVSVGQLQTCAVLSDGTVKCWGQMGVGLNDQGRMIFNSSAPVSISGVSNAVSVTNANGADCALLSDGTIKCWGNNFNGQLGDGSTQDSLTPVSVLDVSNAVSLSSGYGSDCAVLSDGTIKCWGDNSYGALGDGTNNNSSTPVTVTGVSNAVSVSHGGPVGCAVISDTSITCWGNNPWGFRGDGTISHQTTPITVQGLLPKCSWTATASNLHYASISSFADSATVSYRPMGASTWIQVSGGAHVSASGSISGLVAGTAYEVRLERFAGSESLGVEGYVESTLGTGTYSVQVTDSAGNPVALGTYGWSSVDGLTRSSSDHAGTALGAVSFSGVPAKMIRLRVSNAVLADGSTVSGIFTTQASNGSFTLPLPAVSNQVTRQVLVELPSGDQVPGASVTSTNLSSQASLSSDSFSGTVSLPSVLSGTTDASGSVTLRGFATGTVSVAASYDDGDLSQSTSPADATGDVTTLQLDYMPIVQLSGSDQVTANVNTLVSVPLGVGDASSDSISPSSLSTRAGRIHTLSRLSTAAYSGVAVSITPPAGASQTACHATTSLSTHTNSTGHATLKVCASLSGAYVIHSRGAVSSGAVTIHVRNSKPMMVTSLGSASNVAGKALVAWGAPEYNGGSAVTSYTVVAKNGSTTVTRTLASSTAGFRNRSYTFTGLAANKTWTFTVTATNRYGTGPSASTTRIVRGLS